jgi:hypothetical protein
MKITLYRFWKTIRSEFSGQFHWFDRPAPPSTVRIRLSKVKLRNEQRMEILRKTCKRFIGGYANRKYDFCQVNKKNRCNRLHEFVYYIN